MPHRGKPTEHIRRHHAELLGRLGSMRDALDTLSAGHTTEAAPGLEGAVEFLNNELAPHARWEEESLYPVVGELLRTFGKPTATMELEHGILVKLFAEFQDAVKDLLTAQRAKASPTKEGERVKRLGWQIDALLSAHFSEEEDIFLELADRHMSRADVDALLHD